MSISKIAAILALATSLSGFAQTSDQVISCKLFKGEAGYKHYVTGGISRMAIPASQKNAEERAISKCRGEGNTFCVAISSSITFDNGYEVRAEATAMAIEKSCL